MKIYTLMENTPVSPDFLAEHGLSMYIETDKFKILFDTGQSTNFITNAQKLGVDLTEIDFVILSHGHYDHGGGLAEFLNINSTAPIYMQKTAFEDYYAGQERYIGLDKNLRFSERIIFVDNQHQLAENILIQSCNESPHKYAVNTYGLKIFTNNTLSPDTFSHEQYLIIVENGKRFVFSGCSHKNVFNIVNWLQPDILIGGFHFMTLDCNNEEDKTYLTAAADTLLAGNTQYYTCHCTGIEQYNYLKNLMHNRLHYLSSGSVISI